jgi:hypothetical protein
MKLKLTKVYLAVDKLKCDINMLATTLAYETISTFLERGGLINNLTDHCVIELDYRLGGNFNKSVFNINNNVGGIIMISHSPDPAGKSNTSTVTLLSNENDYLHISVAGTSGVYISSIYIAEVEDNDKIVNEYQIDVPENRKDISRDIADIINKTELRNKIKSTDIKVKGIELEYYHVSDTGVGELKYPFGDESIERISEYIDLSQVKEDLYYHNSDIIESDDEIILKEIIVNNATNSDFDISGIDFEFNGKIYKMDSDSVYVAHVSNHEINIHLSINNFIRLY